MGVPKFILFWISFYGSASAVDCNAVKAVPHKV